MSVPGCGERVEGECQAPLPDGGVEDHLPELATLWSLTLGDPRVCIAVLDGPVDLSHPCFDGALIRQVSLPGAADRAMGAGLLHGTHVASLIFGQHHSAVHGVAPKCRGVLIPIFREQQDGSLVPCSQLDLARAISLAVAVGANVINISAGVYDETGEPEPPLTRAIRMCEEQNILIVAAAGNEGCACPHVPAASPTVLAVGAAGRSGEPLQTSNWPDSYRRHGVLAPGEAVAGAAPQGQTVLASGTSVATSLASGIAGLLASWQLSCRRKVDVPAIKSAILAGAVRCEEVGAADCQRWLAGRLNVQRTLAIISRGEGSAMSNSNLPQNAVSVPCLQGTVGESSPEDAANRAEQALTRSGGEGSPQRGTTMPIPPPRESERHLVYALGQVSFDLGTEARRDALVQAGGDEVISSPVKLLEFLHDNPWEATGLTWTLEQQATPIYALQPAGPFARETYQRICDLFKSQIEEGVTQVSIPGMLGPPIRLLNGHQVPMVFPEIRGMFGWSNPKLIEKVLEGCLQAEERKQKYDQLAVQIDDLLDRVYYELSNLGISPPERAVNFAATNLYQVAEVYQDAIAKDLKLDKITTERSQICRPGSDCWDVVLTLFHPERRRDRAREVYRLTVDVSEIIPVTVGKLRRWSVY